MSFANAQCQACGARLPPVSPPAEPTGWPRRKQHLLALAQREQARLAVRRLGRPQARVVRLRAANRSLRIDDMAAVACYFNPFRGRARLRNYRAFQRGIRLSGIPLLTVELAIGDQNHHIPEDLGEVLRVRSRDILWHKERLLNIGFRELLQRGYEKIVWLDGDVVFAHAGHWPWYVADELARVPLCQVFSRVWMPDARGGTGRMGAGAVWYRRQFGQWLRQPPRRRSPGAPAGVPLGKPGYGWAARADLLRDVMLYDAAAVGGGDLLHYAPSLPELRGRSDLLAALTTSPLACPACGARNKSPAYTAHYLQWAERCAAAVDGRVGYVDQIIHTLHHGTSAGRAYKHRTQILYRHAFNPHTDLRRNAEDCWCWASGKPGLRADVIQYFRGRAEDKHGA